MIIATSHLTAKSPKRRLRSRLREERGIALITVLFLLLLMTILGLTMVASVNSDMMINGYYGNSRASFYAADSGVNIARQYLSNLTVASINMTPCAGWGVNGAAGCTGIPLDQDAASNAAKASLLSTYGDFSPLNSGAAFNSRPSYFMISDSADCSDTYVPAPGSPEPHWNSQGTLLDSYKFTFNYTLCSTGTGSTKLQRSAVKESGVIVLTVASSTSAPATFAGYGAFIDNYSPCSAPLIAGLFSGPTFTNSAWELWDQGAYIFTDPVGQVNPKIDYWVGGGCNQSTASNFPGINVQFQQGLQLGQPAIPLPQNAFSQQWAVIDGKGCDDGHGPSCSDGSGGAAPKDAQLNTYFKDASTQQYPALGASSGVFLPYFYNSSSTPPGYSYGRYDSTSTNPSHTLPSGGIYVKGDASILLSIGSDGSGHSTQVYTIDQGGTITTITTNPTANTTTFSSGGTTTTLAGVPTDSQTNKPATLLFVDGTITGLSGPGQGQFAIQDNNKLTITGSHDIHITGDLLYAHEPVTVDTADKLVALDAAYSDQVLGVYTSNGNIDLYSPYSNNNLQVDGSLAAIGQGCGSCGFTVTGYINTFNNVGGQIQSNIFGANMSVQNTYFDRRFTARPGFAPPWFPSTYNHGIVLPRPPTPTVTPQPASWSWIPSQ